MISKVIKGHKRSSYNFKIIFFCDMEKFCNFLTEPNSKLDFHSCGQLLLSLDTLQLTLYSQLIENIPPKNIYSMLAFVYAFLLINVPFYIDFRGVQRIFIRGRFQFQRSINFIGGRDRGILRGGEYVNASRLDTPLIDFFHNYL